MDNNNNNFNNMPSYAPSYSSQPDVKYTPPAGMTHQTFDEDNTPYRAVKKKKRRWWIPFVTVLILAVLASGTIGAIKLWDFGNSLQAQIDELKERPVYTPTAENRSTSASPSTSKGGASVTNSGVLSASDIYAQSVVSCVGISIEVTYQDWFGGVQTGVVSGSGFIISTDGYIVTNNHVISEAYSSNLSIKVTTNDGTEYEAVIVGTEELYDIALLKITPKSELIPLSLGSMDNMRIGDDVYVIGNPLGYLTFTFTEGVLSALDREIKTDSSGDAAINMFQISAPINSGNSGGPVFNAYGEVIGVASAKSSSSSSGDASVEGLGFAIPMDDVRDLIDGWIAVGYRPRAVLGITVQPVNGYDRNSGELIQGAGVIDIVSGGAADQAGILAGDVITALDEVAVTNSTELIETLRKNYAAGDSAVITVYRSVNGVGSYVKIQVTFAESNPEPTPTPEPSLPEWFN